MYDRPAVATFRERLALIVGSDPTVLDQSCRRDIERHLCEVVDELKAAGWPPERVIIAVKKIADDVGLRPSRGVLSAAGPLMEWDAFIVDLIRYTIERYYNAEGKSS